MLLEEGVSTFLKGGFAFISVVFVAGIIVIACSAKSWKAACCFALQWLFTWRAFRFFWEIVQRGGSHPMLTEVNSADLGLSGVCWGVSILLMLLGIYYLVRNINNSEGSENEA